jgi:ribonuclease P protein component
MIARTHRFHGYNALRHVYGRGQIVRGPLLAVKYLPNSRRSAYRAAVVVSRKVHKSAVVRGRIRRRVYEIIRTNEAAITGPYDIVITAFSPQLADIPAGELRQQLVGQLERAGVIDAAAPSTDSPVTRSSDTGATS